VELVKLISYANATSPGEVNDVGKLVVKAVWETLKIDEPLLISKNEPVVKAEAVICRAVPVVKAESVMPKAVPDTVVEVAAMPPVPEVNAKAVAPLLLPTVIILAFAPVPIFKAPVELESIFNAPEELTIVWATLPKDEIPVDPIFKAEVPDTPKLIVPSVSLSIVSLFCSVISVVIDEDEKVNVPAVETLPVEATVKLEVPAVPTENNPDGAVVPTPTLPLFNIVIAVVPAESPVLKIKLALVEVFPVVLFPSNVKVPFADVEPITKGTVAEVVNVGVAIVGDVANTATPVPVSSVKVFSNAADAPVAAKLPEPSVNTALEAVKAVPIVPVKVGPEIVGDVPKTNAPVPLSSEIESIKYCDVAAVVNAPPVVVNTPRDAVSPEKVIVPEEVNPPVEVRSPAEVIVPLPVVEILPVVEMVILEAKSPPTMELVRLSLE
jgi:hypothetical protein